MGGGGMMSPSTLGGVAGRPQRGTQGFAPSLGGDPIQGGTLPGPWDRPGGPGMIPLGGQLGQNAVGGAVQPQRGGGPGGFVMPPGGARVPQAGGAGMGAPAGLTPEVLQMIEAALGGGAVPPGMTLEMAPPLQVAPPGMTPRGGGPAGFQTLPGGPAVPQRGGGPGGFVLPPGGAAVPQGGGQGMTSPPLRPRPVPSPVAPPPGMPTAPQLQSMQRVLGPVPGGFADAASPEAPAAVGAPCPEPQHRARALGRHI